MNLRILVLTSLTVASMATQAQTAVSSDELFKAARNASFEQKDDNKAKQLATLSLQQSPKYGEVEIFLGRLYSWNKQYDSAVYHFTQVLSYAPANEDASIAYSDLEYWNDHYEKALAICINGLNSNPSSSELMLRKAKILNALKQYKEASQAANEVLKNSRHNNTALALASSLRDAIAANKIGISYDYSHFDKQFNKPWHLASVGYSRYTTFGSFSANINYANRFNSSGWQGELEAYPHISKTFYSYVSVGYSPGLSVFPKYRAGFSLYANLPRSFEAEAGIRYLKFQNSTSVYTVYLGKYYSNFLFGARTYVTPGSGGTSHSYSLLARYYLKGPDDYIGIGLGSGISPDDRATNVQYNIKSRFSSRQATVNFNHTFKKMNIVILKLGLLNQEYETDVRGNQLDVSIGLQRRF